MKINYKKASSDDIESLVEFRIKQQRAIGAEEKADIRENLKKYYKKHLDDNTHVSWLALDGDKIAGTSGILFYEVAPSFGDNEGIKAEISGLVVEKEYKRHGIATKLFDYLTDEAKSRGVKTITVTSSTEGAFFYKSYGFKHIDYYYELYI